jgi:hypothetical protein
MAWRDRECCYSESSGWGSPRLPITFDTLAPASPNGNASKLQGTENSLDDSLNKITAVMAPEAFSWDEQGRRDAGELWCAPKENNGLSLVVFLAF